MTKDIIGEILYMNPSDHISDLTVFYECQYQWCTTYAILKKHWKLKDLINAYLNRYWLLPRKLFSTNKLLDFAKVFVNAFYLVR